MSWICLAELFTLQGIYSLSHHIREVCECILGLLCKPAKAVFKHCWHRAISKLVQCLKREWLGRQSWLVLGCPTMGHAGLEKIVLASADCYLSATSSRGVHLRVRFSDQWRLSNPPNLLKTSCTECFTAMVSLLVFSVLLVSSVRLHFCCQL